MTRHQKLSKRLVALFPASCLKAKENSKASFEELLNAYSRAHSLDDAKQYAIDNFDFAKLDVMIFERDNGKSINSSHLPSLPFSTQSLHLSGFDRFFGFPEVHYDVVLYGPEARETLEFINPVQIILRQTTVEVRVIKMEKKISSYYPEERFARVVGNQRVDTVDRIRALFLHNGFVACDINKGVKHFWSNDVIDVRRLQFKNTYSVRVETMDENDIFKKKYPKDYKDILDKPLRSTYFRYLKTDKQWPDNLTIDATQGTLSFTKFAYNQNQLDHVITSILSQN